MSDDGNKEATRLFPSPLGGCQRGCGREAQHRHHRNGDTFDNRRENVEFLCVPCHMGHHHRRPDRVGPGACCNCRLWAEARQIGRCPACYSYYRKKGRDRPLELAFQQRPEAVPRSQLEGIA